MTPIVSEPTSLTSSDTSSRMVGSSQRSRRLRTSAPRSSRSSTIVPVGCGSCVVTSRRVPPGPMAGHVCTNRAGSTSCTVHGPRGGRAPGRGGAPPRIATAPPWHERCTGAGSMQQPERIHDGHTSLLEVRGDEYVYGQFSLRVVRGPDEGREVVPTGDEATVGTEAGCDLVMSDRAVSRHHCSIRVTDAGLELRDL